jgi:hypothetical protein
MIHRSLNLFIIFSVLLISILKLFLPPFNLEWFFLDLANFFNQRSIVLDLKMFKSLQLNTSFYSLIISQLKVENFLEHAYLVRLLNLLSLPFLFYSINIIINYYKKKIFHKNNSKHFSLSLYIIFTPIVFLLVGKAFPDYLSFVLIVCSIALYIKNYFISFTLLIVLSAILKPIALYISPIIIAISYLNSQSLFDKKFFLSIFLATFFAIAYIYKIDKFIVSEEQVSYINVSLLSVFSNYLVYVSYLSVLLLFIVPYKFYEFFKKKEAVLFFIYSGLSILLLIICRTTYGEMSYGFLSYVIKGEYTGSFILFMTFLFYIIISSEVIRSKKKYEKYFFLSINISIFILAAFVERPSQRYLLYIYPFFFLFIFYYFSLGKIKKILIINIFCFFIINLFQFLYFKSFSNVAVKIYNDLSKQKIINETNPLDIFHINGYKFNSSAEFEKKNTYRYIVKYCKKNTDDKNQISVYNIKLINLTIKEICILKINDIS